MQKQIFSLLIALMLCAAPAKAADCGEAPFDAPASVPDGQSATAIEIRAARNAVIAFSAKVDTYMTCMDQRATVLLPYMTKEQKTRWDEDLANLHDKRRELQTAMNIAIRAFRKTQQ
ncbi:MAG: hypothetical protein KUG56_06240 [Kordiimonadaceae bacterium]|nr:hypothetical protein [Kordiimonadaceae bacterium]